MPTPADDKLPYDNKDSTKDLVEILNFKRRLTAPMLTTQRQASYVWFRGLLCRRPDSQGSSPLHVGSLIHMWSRIHLPCGEHQIVNAVRNTLTDLGESISKLVPVWENNTADLRHAVNDVSSKQTRHVQVRLCYARESVVDKLIDVKKIDSSVNVADMLTKLLAFRRFIELRDNGKPHPLMNRVD